MCPDMKEKLESIRKEMAMALWDGRKSQKNSTMMTRVPSKIRNTHVPNTFLEHYGYANPFGEMEPSKAFTAVLRKGHFPRCASYGVNGKEHVMSGTR
jgi:hypothetical protein